MEEQFNPYAVGETQQDHQPAVNLAAGLIVTPFALAAILKTRFWVKLVGVVMIVISVLTFVASIIGDMSGVIVVISTIVSAVYIFMAFKLIQFAAAIQKLEFSQMSSDLSHAIELQRQFWKLVSILVITVLALYVLAIVVVVFTFSSNFN